MFQTSDPAQSNKGPAKSNETTNGYKRRQVDHVESQPSADTCATTSLKNKKINCAARMKANQLSKQGNVGDVSGPKVI